MDSLHPDATDEPDKTPNPGRRGLFRGLLAVGFAFTGAAAGLWTLVTARFLMPNVTTEPPSRFKVGFPRDYPLGYVETRYRERFGVWVLHTVYNGRPQIYALRTVCTHLGCITLWNATEQRFKCPCHGSGFDLRGINCEGPAPRPLERLAIAVADDGQLEIDRQRVFRQELGEWRDPASFVEA